MALNNEPGVVVGIEFKIRLVLGGTTIGLMVFAIFCPPSPYEQIALGVGIACLVLLTYMSVKFGIAPSLSKEDEWLINPETLNEAVIITDLNGNIKATNSAAENILPECTNTASVHDLFQDWHKDLQNKEQSDDVIEAVLSAPEMQFSETLYFESGKVFERVTRAMPNNTARLWLIRDITHLQHAQHENEMHTSMVEADAARTAEMAEQLFHAKAELEAKQAELTRLANTDSLTGLLNRRRFTSLGEKVVKSAAAEDIWIIMMDIDHFKRINDTYGHAAGDVAIRDFATIASTEVGKNGFVGRMGGEEFAAVLESCDRDKAIMIAEGIRKATAAHQTVSEDEKFRFTCSMGVAQWISGEITIEAALDRADQALYSAKSFGRNRVVGYEVEPE